MQTVCLIGKPNVGKSSIFNRLIKEKKAIIMDTPGITRDRIYGVVNYNNKRFSLIDTGGISLGNDNFDKDILAQAELAIDEADIVLFVVDGLRELDASDIYIKDMLHKANKKVIVVVNKLDNNKRQDNLYNYYELGFENLIGVSAEHNLGYYWHPYDSEQNDTRLPRSLKTIILSEKVTMISDSAFEDCGYLERIYSDIWKEFISRLL